MNPVGFDTMSLLILRALRFLGAGGATGEVGGGAVFGAPFPFPGISSYLGPGIRSFSGL